MKTHLIYVFLCTSMLLFACTESPALEEVNTHLILDQEYTFQEILVHSSYVNSRDSSPIIDFKRATENDEKEFKPYKQQFTITIFDDAGQQKTEYGKLVSETLFKNYSLEGDNYWLPTHWKILGYGNAANIKLSATSKFKLNIFPEGYIQIDQDVNLGAYQKVQAGASCEENIFFRFIGTKYEMTSSGTEANFCESLQNILQSVFGANKKLTVVFQKSFE